CRVRRRARPAARRVTRRRLRRRPRAVLRACDVGDGGRTLAIRETRRPRDLGSCGGNEMSRQLTILMPVFNELRTVESAIESVLEAGLSESLEVIVVDDGSTD